MIKDYQNKHLQLNVELDGNPKGTVLRIRTDKEGTPLDRYWRDRVKDSKIDGCVKFVSKPAAKVEKSTSSNKKSKS